MTPQSNHTPAPVGVLIMAYGTPAKSEDIESYYTHIRHGHPPTEELLAELRGRYQAIGGLSPLLKHTRTQVEGIQAALDARMPGHYQTFLGMKHADPFLEASASELAHSGANQAIGLVLAPHYSSMSVAQYMQRVQKTLPASLHFTAIESWHLLLGYITYLAEQILHTRERLLKESGITEEQLEIIFTAHSLPARILANNDPYPRQLRETAEAVARAAGLTHWSIAWQSAGRTADPWIGPDILEVLRELPHKGKAGALVCPAGFVSDHLEVLYDLDIEASQLAASLGLAFARTILPNDNQRVFDALAEMIIQAEYETLI
ncbi:ferrochelatase [Ktedonospora formicarum]|uniref:Ferrochelatase n=1 Tax=Ktedonospora formicarum TaxID=2778364 RepID=A0A8J3I4V8_9CHLR|nr:ferrochelatase [Ktedonospora formicarum]GHO46207.1 ferrochelatase [Ktedonospora formicarum]